MAKQREGQGAGKTRFIAMNVMLGRSAWIASMAARASVRYVILSLTKTGNDDQEVAVTYYGSRSWQEWADAKTIEEVARMGRGNVEMSGINTLIGCANCEPTRGKLAVYPQYEVHGMCRRCAEAELTRLRGIEVACRDLLWSADAAWEENRGGNDWAEACVEARKALEAK